MGSTTHSYAFFDQIVLVPLKLRLQTSRFSLILSLLLLNPSVIANSFGFVRRGDSNAVPGFLIPVHIPALLCFDHGGFERIDTEGHAAFANMKETVETRAA
jgi:hypothetical protein